jgi:hypothetical protein
MTKTTVPDLLDQDITDAERELAAAEQALDGAQTLATRGNPYAVGAMASAQGRVNEATRKLADLRDQQERARQSEAVSARRELARKSAKDLAARADELAASRDALAGHIQAAQDALLALVTAVSDHNALVSQHASEMAAAGHAPWLDGCPSAEPAKGELFVQGETWTRLKADEVYNQVTERVRVARLDTRNYHRVYLAGRGYAAARQAHVVVSLVEPPARATSAVR